MSVGANPKPPEAKQRSQHAASTAHERHRRWLQKAGILTAALPYMQLYAGSLLVIKLGGNALEEAEKDLAAHLAHDVVLLKQVGIHPVIVHGGGPQIDRFAEKLNLEQKRVEGLRITDKETRDCAAMTLSRLSKKVVRLLQGAGGDALALCGQDAAIMRVEKLSPKKQKNGETIDLGFVGEPKKVDATLLRLLIDADYIPVLAPVAADEEGELYNVNADAFAGALAIGLEAKRLLLMTDVAGVKDEKGNLLEELDEKRLKELVAKGVVHGGMLPKINTAMEASRKGVSVVILDGRVPHTLLLELFTETGVGSLIRAV